MMSGPQPNEHVVIRSVFYAELYFLLVVSVLYGEKEAMWSITLSLIAVPLVTYALMAFRLRRILWAIVDPGTGEPYAQTQAAALTLAGFSFAALALFVHPAWNSATAQNATYLGAEGLPSVVFCFGVALCAFILAHIILRSRQRYWTLYAAEGFIDTGVWSAMMGLLTACRFNPALSALTWAFAAMIGLTFMHIAYTLLCWVRMADGPHWAPKPADVVTT